MTGTFITWIKNDTHFYPTKTHQKTTQTFLLLKHTKKDPHLYPLSYKNTPKWPGPLSHESKTTHTFILQKHTKMTGTFITWKLLFDSRFDNVNNMSYYKLLMRIVWLISVWASQMLSMSIRFLTLPTSTNLQQTTLKIFRQIYNNSS